MASALCDIDPGDGGLAALSLTAKGEVKGGAEGQAESKAPATPAPGGTDEAGLPPLPTDKAQEYEMYGRHALISLYECDLAALADVDSMRAAVLRAVAAAGATLLGSTEHVFAPPPGMDVAGYSLAVNLSESNANLHTYPEHRALFADIFCCGRTCRVERFHDVLREHFAARRHSLRILDRH